MASSTPEGSVEKAIANSSRRTLRWALSFFIAIVVITSGLIFYVLREPNLYYPLRLTSSLELIRFFKPESYQPDRLVKQAREAVFDMLDRYSGYLEPRELDRVTEEFSGSYGGIGITIVSHDAGLMVMSVREDGPAGRAGMLTGDIILRADTINLADINAHQATYVLRGPEGSTLDLLVTRNGMADTLKFTLTRKNLKLIHIPFAGLTASGVFYVRILDFEGGVTEELKAALDSHLTEKTTGIIIDLRGNTGGLLNEGVSVANLFLDEGHLIVGTKGRSRWQETAYYSTGIDLTSGLPMAVIVDRGSASAAEIMAGALKYIGRAVLVGDTTFGKGLVQEYRGLGDGSGIRLTTSRYFFEGGIFLNDPESEVIDSGGGIAPDYYIETADRDLFLRQLRNSLLIRDFAMEYQDEILLNSNITKASPGWFERFIDYAHENGFIYKSGITELAELTKDMAIWQNCGKETIEAVDHVYSIARKDDSTRFYTYRETIVQSLHRMAVEYKYGLSRAYRDAVLPYRPDIRLAEEILIGPMP